MCNLYAMTRNAEAIHALARVLKWSVGNLLLFEGIFPNGFGPIVRNIEDRRELAMAHWRMSTSPKFLEWKPCDTGVTNIRTTTSPSLASLAKRSAVPVPRPFHQLQRVRSGIGLESHQLVRAR
ncbi:hypothetical protein [Asticcacaulis sp. YBE204]|uniref:hypothetical protein n=1 Tax=Asticcacaulis sp. YBE204 TaxID=1282363 RepID=UPI00190F5C6D|nr:hypothetical protein [Asticcacaulis sp. YBE204]